MIQHSNDEDEDARCPFCNAKPIHVRDVYPKAKEDLVSCPTSEEGGGCPASGTWVTRERWNKRDGPEGEALIALRNFVEPDLQQESQDAAVIVWLVMNHVDGLRGMLEVDAQEITRINDLLEAGGVLR